MRISRSWLSDYVDVGDLSDERFADLVTTKIAEVDAVETVGSSVEAARIGLIEKVAPHPAKDTLKVATVALGDTQVDVVCGATNCRAGIFVPYVPSGTEIRNAEGEAFFVERREVFGVLSPGMLCSEFELGVGSDHSGLCEIEPELLPSGAESGLRLSSVLGETDLVLVIDNKSLTHRPDLWSHLGFARELSAVLRRPLKRNPDRFADHAPEGAELLARLGSGPATFTININPNSRCRRFAGIEFEGVCVRPSPRWMRRRLFSVGAGVRNLLVDLSNYVMHDIGQPNHAYDVALLAGRVVDVRMAREGESFIGLDGIERKLSEEDVVIADERSAVALGGVIGGQLSSIVETTDRLFLESANFDPVIVRQTTKRHALRTDASNRFEKSRSPYAVPLALHRFAELLLEIEPQARIVGGVADCFPNRPPAVQVSASFDYLRSRLGVSAPDSQIRGILESLGFILQKKEGANAEVDCVVPYERATRDISIPDDLVEEVGRIYGYDKIPETAPLIASTPQREGVVPALENKVRDLLCAAGFSEVHNYSFMSGAAAEAVGYSSKDAVRLLNPMDSQSDLIRTTLVPGMLSFVESNLRHASAVLLFEIGRTYHLQRSKLHEALGFKDQLNTAATERRLLNIAYVSGMEESRVGAATQPPVPQGADFYALAGVLRRVGRSATSLEAQLRPLSASGELSADTLRFDMLRSWMHPHRAATISFNGTCVGVIAEVKPGLRADLSRRVIIAELDLELLYSKHLQAERFTPLPRYPESFFEVSVVMPERSEFSELNGLLRAASDPELLKSIEVTAVYRGKPLKDDQKSVSVRLSFGSLDRTLSGEEVSTLQQAVISGIKESSFFLRS